MAGYFDDLPDAAPSALSPALATVAPPALVGALAPPAAVAAKPLPNLPGYVGDPADPRPGVAIPLGGPGSQGDGSPQAAATPGLFDDLPDGRPASQTYGFLKGAEHVGSNLFGMLQDDVPGMPSALSAAQSLEMLPLRAFGHQIGADTDAAFKGYRPGRAGAAAGEIAASLPFTLEGGPLLAGAAGGLLASDATTPLGKARDAAEGAVFGKAADMALGPVVGAINDRLHPSPFDRPQQRALGFIAQRTPATMTPEALEQAPQHLMPAEVMGPRMVGYLDAIANQPGQTGEALAETVERRRDVRPGEILKGVRDATREDPESAASTIDRIVAQGRADAKPLYDQAFDDTPFWDRKLEDLSQRPSVQDAMKGARRLMREESVDPETLGIDFLENPSQWATEAPPATAIEPERPGVGFAGGLRGPSKPPPQGPSLLKFIADNGGIDDASGDVTAMGGDQWHLGKAYQRRLVGDQQPDSSLNMGGGQGRTLAPQQPDDVALRAWEAGYFPHLDERPSINDLYDAMGDELRGKALYARPADEAAQLRYDRMNAAEELAYRGDDGSHLAEPDGYGARPAPTDDPVWQRVPKVQTWDYVKRALDDQLVPYVSGAKEWTDEARLMNQTRADLVAHLRGLSPKYAQALDTSGDYLGAHDAYKYGLNNFFLRSTTPKTVGEMVAGQPYSVRRGMKLGVSEALRRSVNGQGGVNATISQLIAGDSRGKLQALLGSRNAQKLFDVVDQQKAMRDVEGSFKNSATAKRQAIQAEIDGAPPPLAQAAKTAIRFGPTRAFWEMVHAGGSKLIDGFTTRGLDEPARNEAGVMLGADGSSPAELAQALRRYLETRGGAPTSADAARRVARGMIGSSAPQLLAPVNNPTPY